jgi:hypothetical protein
MPSQQLGIAGVLMRISQLPMDCSVAALARPERGSFLGVQQPHSKAPKPLEALANLPTHH